MRKGSTKQRGDDLRREYDLASLKGVVRGKYYQRAVAGTNLVPPEPDSCPRVPPGQPLCKPRAPLAARHRDEERRSDTKDNERSPQSDGLKTLP